MSGGTIVGDTGCNGSTESVNDAVQASTAFETWRALPGNESRTIQEYLAEITAAGQPLWNGGLNPEW